MVVIRNRIATARAGGPRQFAELRNRLLVSVAEGSVETVRSQMSTAGVETKILANSNTIVAEPESRVEEVLDKLSQQRQNVSDAVDEISQAREEGERFLDSEVVLEATDALLGELGDIEGVTNIDFAHSFADFGPENLRLSPTEMETVENPREVDGDNLEDVLTDLNIGDAWQSTRGEGAVVAIFDTGYSRDLISSDRVVDTFHSDDTDSAFAPAEGHGTMCAGAAAASKDEGVPFNGAAPNAQVVLVRVTGADGQIRSDVIAEAWDWINNRARQTDRPHVLNHSYGTPICSVLRKPEFCGDPLSDVIRAANSTPQITSCYAAGNEAMYCGHRPSGLTNGITAHNSLEDVVTVGALLSNGRDAQRYSSHGRGDCAPRADPKPNVSYRIPEFTYYGAEGGWKIKDMSTGPFGSGGGTSHASPLTCGTLALAQSFAIKEHNSPLQTEELKQVIKRASDPPRRTQINSFGLFAGPDGWDARFGHGQLRPDKMLDEVSNVR